ncbi:alpha/beta-hydrolase [Ophiobolus disseminans]|uniref:Carboxylic ester hydrolase n=1 Tax=Ophiobolus disseminans TaxID=1469910 RepID=A0A6A6ZX01_9PLEO|nr:alpha/beta-hydrolase [Ophiobolus disseminans]
MLVAALAKLDDGTYEGIFNASTGLNVFKGIRFAAPPTDSLRWQAPQKPKQSTSPNITATAFGSVCPHSFRAGQSSRALPSDMSEDCLFLNVYAPHNGSGLPVLVHIHGGGYGVGDGRQDLTNLITANGNTFIAVSIQYRLGAFGFLAGDEVFRHGVVNAALLDQQFALQWVQDNIDEFGGDPRKVTIFGISAGGGSVMLHDMAYGGTQGTSLFNNSISFSPYLPQQYNYNDWIPTQGYYAFAAHAGCAATWAYGNTSETIFQCLVSKDTDTLQAASNAISSSGLYGTWAFLPVTDGDLVPSRPSYALFNGKLNGVNQLTSNVAEESFVFVPQNIESEECLRTWIRRVFPLFDDQDVSALLLQYPHQDSSGKRARHATSGTSSPSALGTSATASGYQQLANLVYAESTFVCPSYWLAQAYNTEGKRGFKKQFSVPIALHGYDGVALFGNTRLSIHGDELVSALQSAIGRYVRTGDPGWLPYTSPEYPMFNVNQTGGREVPVESTLDPSLNTLGASWSIGPDLHVDFSIVNGYTWEGGRGARCEFWKQIAAKVPM